MIQFLLIDSFLMNIKSKVIFLRTDSLYSPFYKYQSKCSSLSLLGGQIIIIKAMNNYHSVASTTQNKRSFLDSLKLKYSRQKPEPSQFTMRQPLQDYSNINCRIPIDNKQPSTRDHLSLRKNHERSHSYSRPELANFNVKHQIGAKAINSFGSNSLSDAIVESIALKKIVSAKLNESTGQKITLKQKTSRKDENQNYDIIVRSLESPIKLINNFSPLKQQRKEPKVSEMLKMRNQDKQKQFKAGRQTTNQTIASIDNILASIKQTLGQK